MKKRDYKSGLWLLHALLLYAVVMATDEALWTVAWYWSLGLFAAAASGWLIARGLLRGVGRGWRGPRLATVWFAVCIGLGCYVAGAWMRGWLAGGAVWLHPAGWIVAALVAPAAVWFRNGRFRRAVCLLAAAAGLAGLALQPAFERPGDAEALRRLAALPYAGGAPVSAGGKARATVGRPEAVQPGATLLVLKLAPREEQDTLGAVLVDSAGAPLRAETFREAPPFFFLKDPGEMLRVARDPVLEKGVDAVVKRDDVHHDVSLTADGRIRALMRVFSRNLRASGLPVPMAANYFKEFSRDGRWLRTVDLAPVSGPWISGRRIARARAALYSNKLFWHLLTLPDYSTVSQRFGDVFDLEHANALAEIPEAVPGVCARGDVLVSFWHCRLAGVLDLAQNRLVWTWQSAGEEGFHTPVWTGRGTVLLFETDAGDSAAGASYSRVVEVDLRSRQIVWSFAGQPPGSLYSPSQGACQLLPNGNVLVTWSTDCRVQEVTRQGEVVWDYRYAPEGAFPLVESVYRAIRLCDEGQIDAVRGYLDRVAGARRYKAAVPDGGCAVAAGGPGPDQKR